MLMEKWMENICTDFSLSLARGNCLSFEMVSQHEKCGIMEQDCSPFSAVKVTQCKRFWAKVFHCAFNFSRKLHNYGEISSNLKWTRCEIVKSTQISDVWKLFQTSWHHVLHVIPVKRFLIFLSLINSLNEVSLYQENLRNFIQKLTGTSGNNSIWRKNSVIALIGKMFRYSLLRMINFYSILLKANFHSDSLMHRFHSFYKNCHSYFIFLFNALWANNEF